MLAVISIVACVVVSSACSGRDSLPRLDAPASCVELLAAPQEGEPLGLPYAVWLMNEPPSDAPLVMNWKQRRIAGEPANVRQHGGRTWLVSSEHAVSVDWQSDVLVEGEWLRCDARREVTTRYTAVPLAPAPFEPYGLTEVARYPADEQAWPEQRTSDLALQRPDLVVVARGPDGLRWLRVAPSHDGLTEVGRLPPLLGDDYNDVVAIDERYVAVASRLLGLVIVDAADPAEPHVVVDALPRLLPRDGHSVAMLDRRLYLAQAPVVSTGALAAFDVSEPQRPRELWRWQPEVGHDVHDVTAHGDTLYVSSIRGGVTILKSGDDAVPRVIARRPGLAAHSCSVVEPEAKTTHSTHVLWGEEQVGGSLHLMQLEGASLTARQVQLGIASTAGVAFAASPHNSECRGQVCFVAHYQLGLQVLQIQTPVARAGNVDVPVVARYPTWRPTARGESMWLRGAVGVALDLPWVYVADTDAGVVMLRYETMAPPPRDQAQ